MTIGMACKKPIFTKLTDTPTNYLVVNGNIAPSDTTTITLSRLISVNDTAKSNPETSAIVTIEGSKSGIYTLTSKNNGTYVVVPLNLPTNQNYRIKIITSNGRQYASDFVPLKNSPPIDSINYVIKNDGLQINANTHDATNNTHYYRWDYVETYIIHTDYFSNFMEVNHDTVDLRPVDQRIYQCWVTNKSSNLLLASSAKLSQDIISSQLLTEIPSNSDKVRLRYSISVNQYALTPDAYNYFTLLQKNTEQTGGIFDAQPSALTGNIHSLTNKNEPVIGYITAGSISTTRIFIDSSNLPAWTYIDPNAVVCELDTMLYLRLLSPGPPPRYNNDVAAYIYTDEYIPIDKLGSAGERIGFTAALPICADCTLQGTNKQPLFWK